MYNHELFMYAKAYVCTYICGRHIMPMVYSIVNFYDMIFNTYNQLCVSQVN